jgi:L-rhamnose mutarotase
MQVHEGREGEYEERHRSVWPELREVLREHGASNYSIFLHPGTLQLFAYVEIESEEQWNLIAETDVCRKWWSCMKDIMPTNKDESPRSVDLREVFHMD